MVRLRKAARAVVLDTDDRILLVRFEFPTRAVWATPGGGIDEGESDEQAILRELDEELGLVGAELGPWIWTREHHFLFESGLWDGQVERFVVVRTEPFVPSPRFTPEELAAEYLTGMRWWTLAELRASGEEFAPSRLPQLVESLLRDGPPAEPIDAGV